MSLVCRGSSSSLSTGVIPLDADTSARVRRREIGSRAVGRHWLSVHCRCRSTGLKSASYVAVIAVDGVTAASEG